MTKDIEEIIMNEGQFALDVTQPGGGKQNPTLDEIIQALATWATKNPTPLLFWCARQKNPEAQNNLFLLQLQDVQWLEVTVRTVGVEGVNGEEWRITGSVKMPDETMLMAIFFFHATKGVEEMTIML